MTDIHTGAAMSGRRLRCVKAGPPTTSQSEGAGDVLPKRNTQRVDIDDDLLTILSGVARHTRIYAQRVYGLTAQFMVLARLERQPDVSQNELAAVAEVAPMTIARLIDRLEERGLVKRCPDPEDRRIWRLQLTPAAAPIVRETNQLRAKLHNVMTKGIDPTVLAAMTEGLRQMKENVSSRRLAKASAQGNSHVQNR
jgi:MarR family transcriptional regulator, transcriptional regulator for hemolysin